MRDTRTDGDTQVRIAQTGSLIVQYERTGPDTGVPIVIALEAERTAFCRLLWRQ